MHGKASLFFVTDEVCDGILVEAEPRALAVDLGQDAVLINLLHGTVDPPYGDDLVTLLQIVHHFLVFFLALLLGTIDEEVEDPDDEHEREQEAHKSATATAGLADEENRIEG